MTGPKVTGTGRGCEPALRAAATANRPTRPPPRPATRSAALGLSALCSPHPGGLAASVPLAEPCRHWFHLARARSHRSAGSRCLKVTPVAPVEGARRRSRWKTGNDRVAQPRCWSEVGSRPLGGPRQAARSGGVTSWGGLGRRRVCMAAACRGSQHFQRIIRGNTVLHLHRERVPLRLSEPGGGVRSRSWSERNPAEADKGAWGTCRRRSLEEKVVPRCHWKRGQLWENG